MLIRERLIWLYYSHSSTRWCYILQTKYNPLFSYQNRGEICHLSVSDYDFTITFIDEIIFSLSLFSTFFKQGSNVFLQTSKSSDFYLSSRYALPLKSLSRSLPKVFVIFQPSRYFSTGGFAPFLNVCTIIRALSPFSRRVI